jgi:hypothetical protein
MTYSQLTICGLINILAIVLLIAKDNQPKQLAWQQIQQQQASISGKAAIEQSRVEQSKLTADAYAKNLSSLTSTASASAMPDWASFTSSNQNHNLVRQANEKSRT